MWMSRGQVEMNQQSMGYMRADLSDCWLNQQHKHDMFVRLSLIQLYRLDMGHMWLDRAGVELIQVHRVCM